MASTIERHCASEGVSEIRWRSELKCDLDILGLSFFAGSIEAEPEILVGARKRQ